MPAFGWALASEVPVSSPSASGHKVSSGDQVMALVEVGSKGYRPSGGELCWFFSGIGWMICGDGEVCQWLSGVLDVQEQKLYLLDCLLFVSCLNRCGRVWDNCHCSLCYVGYQSMPWSRNCFFKSLYMLLVSCMNVFWLNWYHHSPKILNGGENNWATPFSAVLHQRLQLRAFGCREWWGDIYAACYLSA